MMRNAALQRPGYIQLEPVGGCNLACPMCPVTFRRDAPGDGSFPIMPYETYLKLLDQFTEAKRLHLQGLGEPLLHPRFFDMVRAAADRGLVVTTNTNLTALLPRRAPLCIDCGLAELHVSMDSARPDVYESIRIGARFEQVKRNLEALVRAKEAANTALPDIEIVAVLMQRTLPGLSDLVEFAAAYGIKRVFVQHLSHDFGEASLPAHYRPMRSFIQQESVIGMDPEVLACAYREAETAAARFKVDLRLPPVGPRTPKPIKGPRCSWPWTGVCISFQGYVMPCCMVSTPDRINFGSINDASLSDIWESANYNLFRKGLLDGKPHDVCAHCSIYKGTF